MTDPAPSEGAGRGRRDHKPERRGQEGHETAQESPHHHSCACFEGRGRRRCSRRRW